MRRDKAAVLAFAALLGLTAAACGGKSGAATDAGVDTGGATDTAATGCDPAVQNCGAGSKCDFGCEGSAATLACRPDNGGGAIGAACSATTPCTAGNACLGAPDGGIVCRKYCGGDGDCATGERCHNVNVTVTCSGGPSTLPLHYCY